MAKLKFLRTYYLLLLTTPRSRPRSAVAGRRDPCHHTQAPSCLEATLDASLVLGVRDHLVACVGGTILNDRTTAFFLSKLGMHRKIIHTQKRTLSRNPSLERVPCHDTGGPGWL